MFGCMCVITGEMGSFSTMKTHLCVQEQTHSHAFEKKKIQKTEEFGMLAAKAVHQAISEF